MFQRGSGAFQEVSEAFQRPTVGFRGFQGVSWSFRMSECLKKVQEGFQVVSEAFQEFSRGPRALHGVSKAFLRVIVAFKEVSGLTGRVFTYKTI